jgi:hypothetical protein
MGIQGEITLHIFPCLSERDFAPVPIDVCIRNEGRNRWSEPSFEFMPGLL